MIPWQNFFVAIVSAAAALTGLIFVGVSISLTRILSIPKMPSRAFESLLLLLMIVIISSLCLVPSQSAFLLGLEILCLGLFIWVITLRIDISLLKNTDAENKKHSIQNIVFTQLAVLPYIIAGISTIKHGFEGIYWLLPGIIFSLIKALVDAWVILVEINR